MQEKKQTKLAAALEYNPQKHSAPVLTAVGKGQVAERIVEKAKEHGVPIVEDTSLAKVLGVLSVGDAIPSELYEAVAQVLVFISNQDAKFNARIPR